MSHDSVVYKFSIDIMILLVVFILFRIALSTLVFLCFHINFKNFYVYEEYTVLKIIF